MHSRVAYQLDVPLHVLVAGIEVRNEAREGPLLDDGSPLALTDVDEELSDDTLHEVELSQVLPVVQIAKQRLVNHIGYADLNGK